MEQMDDQPQSTPQVEEDEYADAKEAAARLIEALAEVASEEPVDRILIRRANVQYVSVQFWTRGAVEERGFLADVPESVS